MVASNLRFVHLGYGFIVCANRIVAVFPPKSEQAKRMMRFAKTSQTYIDMTRGRETKCYILLEDGAYIGCAFNPLTVLKRLNEDPSPRNVEALSSGAGQPMESVSDEVEDIDADFYEDDEDEKEGGNENN